MQICSAVHHIVSAMSVQNNYYFYLIFGCNKHRSGYLVMNWCKIWHHIGAKTIIPQWHFSRSSADFLVATVFFLGWIRNPLSGRPLSQRWADRWLESPRKKKIWLRAGVGVEEGEDPTVVSEEVGAAKAEQTEARSRCGPTWWTCTVAGIPGPNGPLVDPLSVPASVVISAPSDIEPLRDILATLLKTQRMLI